MPAHVLDKYNNTPKHQQAEVLKLLFDKGDTGRWVANFNKPIFQEHYERVNKDFNHHKMKGRPRMIMEETMPGGVIVPLMCLVYLFCL